MKKFVTLLLVAALMLTLFVGCKNGETTPTTEATTEATTEEVVEATTETPDTDTEAPADATTEAATDAPAGGCGAVVSWISVSLLAVMAAWVCTKKKDHI